MKMYEGFKGGMGGVRRFACIRPVAVIYAVLKIEAITSADSKANEQSQ